MSSIAEAVAAALGGFVSTTLVYPVDLLKTVVQNDTGADRERSNERLELTHLKRIYTCDGLLGFYRGFASKSFQLFYEDLLYYYVYDNLREYFLSWFAKTETKTELPFSIQMLSASLAGAVQFLVTTPIEIISTSLQASKQTLQGVTTHIYRKKGIMGFWDGYFISCLLTINPAINFAVLEKLKSWFVKYNEKLTATEAFLIAMCAKMIAITTVYPLIRVKILSQAVSDSLETMGLRRAVLEVQTKGLGVLYQGLPPQLARSMLAAGVMFAVHERCRESIKKILWPALSNRED
jgi:hypothetical protein